MLSIIAAGLALLGLVDFADLRGFEPDFRPEPAGRRGVLALIFTAQLRVSIRTIGRGGQLQKGKLADFQVPAQRNGQPGQVAQLQGEIALPARIDEPGRGVDDQSYGNQVGGCSRLCCGSPANCRAGSNARI